MQRKYKPLDIKDQLYNLMNSTDDIDKAGEEMSKILQPIPFDKKEEFFNDFKTTYPRPGKYFDLDYQKNRSEGIEENLFRLKPIEREKQPNPVIPVEPLGNPKVVGQPNFIQRLTSPARRTRNWSPLNR